MKCSKCGSEFDGTFCPMCGNEAKNDEQNGNVGVNNYTVNQEYMGTYTEPVKKKPIYKKPWFFGILAAVAVVIIIIIAVNVNSNKIGFGNTEKIVWSEMKLGDKLPEPPVNKGRIWTNSDNELNIDLVGLSENMQNDYINECKEMGYTIDAEDDMFSYDAFNDEGYNLEISYFSGEEMTIELTAPIKMTTISWPTIGAGKLLPIPESLFGKISDDSENRFNAKIGDTPIEKYNAYVNKVIEAGFNVDYSKDEKYFTAKNAEGYKVRLEYVGCNVMSISVEAPIQEETTTQKPTETTTQKPVETTAPASNPPASNPPASSSGIRSDFKAAMDEYEAFINEYVSFMARYNANPNDPSLLTDYLNYLGKYSSMVASFDSWSGSDLNAEELNYYIEVQTRVSQKLLGI